LAIAVALLGAFAAPAFATEKPSSLDQVLDQIVARERGVLDRLEEYEPLVETYLQSVKPDGLLGWVPVKDQYFLGRLQLGGKYRGSSKNKDKDKDKRRTGDLVDLYHYSVTSNADGFAKMLTLDAEGFSRQNYEFAFVRREFLGEVRTLVFDVLPVKTKGSRPGRFTGRIWVEDRDYNIVRYNGLYGSVFRTNLHFDSWRVNVGPGMWLPAYVYTEEPQRAGGDPKVKYKGQTRIWGYDIGKRDADDAFTKVMIEADLTEDSTEQAGQVSPVESFRAWEREAEDNVLSRLNRAGFLAPEGEVSDVLETVVANLEVTNDLNIHPPIRCRVLLTTPLESFTVGHTIVLSRGLIDVLPDEASLAMVLAHEMGHILSGHRLDTKYAFSDHMLINDKQALDLFEFERDSAEELEADAKAVELLMNSPYKDKLEGAGLFLKVLAENTNSLATLIQPHFGNRMAVKDQMQRLSKIVDSAPALDPDALDQLAALPLGGRVKVDPWTAEVELMKNTRVTLLSPREKMPFQVTPLMPYLMRYGSSGATAGKRETGPDKPAESSANGSGEAVVSKAR
jgi:hypothetical protein